MKRLIVSALLVLGLASASQAQISRVFVAVTGNDANDCLQPVASCRTLNGAIAKVDAGGEVIVIETGSYAGATITKSVKINIPSGAVAFSALTLLINAGPTAVIVIRGVTMKALTVGAGNGIDVQSAGSVLIENCIIDGWANGVNVATGAKVEVKDSTLRSNGNGVLVSSAAATLSVDQSRLIGNAVGFQVSGGSATIGRTLMAGNGSGAVSSGAGTKVLVSRSQISGQTANGLRVETGASGQITDSLVAGNLTGLSNAGTLVSAGNNAVSGNGTDTSGAITTVALQ